MFDRSRFMDRELLDPARVMETQSGCQYATPTCGEGHQEGGLDFLKQAVDLGVRASLLCALLLCSSAPLLICPPLLCSPAPLFLCPCAPLRLRSSAPRLFCSSALHARVRVRGRAVARVCVGGASACRLQRRRSRRRPP